MKIIAEAGINHNGCLNTARSLVAAAKESGAHAVKFQTFDPKRLVTRDAPLASYQKDNLGQVVSQYQMLESVKLSRSDHIELKSYCDELSIEFLSTPFDEQSLDLLLEIGCQAIKISSGDLTNRFLLEAVAKFNLRTLISTGMADEREVSEAVDCVYEAGLNWKNLTLLHCTTEYPCPLSDVNLRVIPEMKKVFNVEIGYSDHTDGITVAVAAVAMGATTIEKHLTLDRNAAGPDHKASLEPRQFNEMVRAIKEIQLALGDSKKQCMPSEMKNMSAARKSLVARDQILQGEVFSRDKLAAKRPGNGISPMRLDEIIGEVARRTFSEDEQIDLL